MEHYLITTPQDAKAVQFSPHKWLSGSLLHCARVLAKLSRRPRKWSDGHSLLTLSAFVMYSSNWYQSRQSINESGQHHTITTHRERLLGLPRNLYQFLSVWRDSKNCPASCIVRWHMSYTLIFIHFSLSSIPYTCELKVIDSRIPSIVTWELERGKWWWGSRMIGGNLLYSILACYTGTVPKHACHCSIYITEKIEIEIYTVCTFSIWEKKGGEQFCHLWSMAQFYGFTLNLKLMVRSVM